MSTITSRRGTGAGIARQVADSPYLLRRGPSTQPDPIGLTGGLNVYLFVEGDPVNYADPSGLAPDCTQFQLQRV